MQGDFVQKFYFGLVISLRQWEGMKIKAIKIVPKRSGKYEIDCTHGDGSDCNISRLYIRDIRDDEETLLEEEDEG